MAECVRYIIGSRLSPVTIFFDFPASEVDRHHMDLVLYQESCCWIACCLGGARVCVCYRPTSPTRSQQQCAVLGTKSQFEEAVSVQIATLLHTRLPSHHLPVIWEKNKFLPLTSSVQNEEFMHKLQIQKVNPNIDIILSHRIWNFPNLTIFMLVTISHTFPIWNVLY